MSKDLKEATRADVYKTTPARGWAKNLRGATLTVIGVTVATLLVFVLVEGATSFVIFAHRMLAYPPGEDRRHARFDPELGWVNIPNIFIPDMWGPGVYLRTNARGFRNNQDIGARVPEGKLRVICSGDSFTQGYGVDNDDAFCQRLGFQDPRFEPVNMGQAGYGIDQAFMWYQRDGSVIDHDLHIFALITDDFWRMQTSKYNGYAKPVLRLRDGAVVAENVPVRESSFLSPWLVRLQAAAAELRTVIFVEKLQRRASSAQPPIAVLDEHTREIALRIFTSLAEVNQAKNSTLVLVYLPTKWDYYYEDGTTEVMRKWLQAEAEKRGIFFVDLVDEMRKLPPESIDAMFIPGHWHYTPMGNEWVATMLRQRLISDPKISARLAGIAAERHREAATDKLLQSPAGSAAVLGR